MKRSHIEAIDLLKERHAAELLQLTVENERKLAKSDASHRVMLEELGAAHRDQVQAARDVVEKQMHMAVNQVQVLCESTQHKLLSVTKENYHHKFVCVNMQKEGAEMQVRELQQELDAWRDKEKKLIQIMEHAQRMNANVEERHLSLECKHLDAQKQLEELALSVQSLQATIANQRDLIDELERSRQVQFASNFVGNADEYVRELGGVETEKLECRREIAHLQEQHSRDVLALEVMKRNQDHTIKQITQAQFSANRLIEEQAKTIEDLLESRMNQPNEVCMTKANNASCRRPQCHAMAEALHDMQSNRPSQHQLDDLQTLLKQTNHQVSVLEREKQKLARVVEEQAVTIHELTMQDEHGVNGINDGSDASSNSGNSPETHKWDDLFEVRTTNEVQMS
ncbi:hypothetical protein AaE_001492 [Aphanomyces astaci]|uniref:Protein FAM184A/B N-terminal domain-containing protein n=1 Tax=Aphanomyces astaci TaxID=112090 RepID=A0A6A5AWE8_APHAT|nr:hypothetical protein AaE_001492 [Aphanomyces astaci]